MLKKWAIEILQHESINIFNIILSACEAKGGIVRKDRTSLNKKKNIRHVDSYPYKVAPSLTNDLLHASHHVINHLSQTEIIQF